jgi:hypothetical protein
MNRQARVDSFPALREFRASLATFAAIAATTLDEASTDIQRTLQWLREDRRRYWKAQVQTRTQQYTRARLLLKQREVLDRALAGTRSSCVDEKKNLQIAERRLRAAENTFRLLGVYTRQIEKESLDFKGAVRGLVSAVETEIPNACARLDRMADSLEKYVALAPPEMPVAPREGIDADVLEPCQMPPAEDPASEMPAGEDIRDSKHGGFRDSNVTEG